MQLLALQGCLLLNRMTSNVWHDDAGIVLLKNEKEAAHGPALPLQASDLSKVTCHRRVIGAC